MELEVEAPGPEDAQGGEGEGQQGEAGGDVIRLNVCTDVSSCLQGGKTGREGEVEDREGGGEGKKQGGRV